MISLKEEIRKSYSDESIFTNLLKQFEPLIRKYSFMLHDADSYWDLQADFVSLFKSINPDNFPNYKFILSYIRKSIYHSYIALSKSVNRYCRLHKFKFEMSPEEQKNRKNKLNQRSILNSIIQ